MYGLISDFELKNGKNRGNHKRIGRIDEKRLIKDFSSKIEIRNSAYLI
jgi:hypothetical protein